MKASLRNLQGKKTTDEQDALLTEHIFNEHQQRISDYERLLDLTVSEFSSLGNCEIPGCAVHHTPNTSPVKNSNPDFPPIVKTTNNKRKETEIDFVPPTRKLSKNLKINENTSTNFRIDLSNRFDGLENQEPIETPVAGTSTGNASATSTNKNATTIVPENERKLPPQYSLKSRKNTVHN
ncbi:hypothetical protein TNCV_2959571 [Trichonephila clavipes]|nr:hypothetical protein TNCV_2959571 [Trichonephila clavipes]